MNLTRSNKPLTTVARHPFRGASAISALLGALACGGQDATLLDVDEELPGAEGPSDTAHDEWSHAASEAGGAWEAGDAARFPETDPAELERLLLENQARLEQWQRDAAARFSALTAEEHAALAQLTPPSSDTIMAEWDAHRSGTLTPDEESAVRDLLATQQPGTELTFRGRTVVQGDVLHSVDALLATTRSGSVAKAEMLTGTETEGAFYDVRPHTYATEDSASFKFWRPDTGRRYYVVVPNGVDFLFNGLVQATNDITAALSDDCLSGLFTVVYQSTYDQLAEIERITTSVITVRYESTICGGVVNGVNVAGCASYPFRQNLMQSPTDWLFRMRLGHILGFQPGALNASNARYVALHELTHTLGFFHPVNPEFDPDYDRLDDSARVPTTAQGTAPSIMWTTDHYLFSSQVSSDDRQALRKTYSGSCGYFGGLRTIGARCSDTDEARCIEYGAACEVDANVGLCRWAQLRDSAACFQFSQGTWKTSNAPIFPGEPGACVAPASTLPQVPDTFGTVVTASADYAGRRCTQDSAARGVLFHGLSSVYASTFYCSDQLGVWDPGDWRRWEFSAASEVTNFPKVGGSWSVTTEGTPGTSGFEGYYTQALNEAQNWSLTNRSLTHGCVSTNVKTNDNGFSGIIFDYVDANNYYVFELQPSVRRRIRRVQNGVGTTLSSISLNYATNWSAGITLTVCYGDGIHTFLDDKSRVSITHVPNGSGQNIPLTFSLPRPYGLYNSYNSGAKHRYLRTFPLVEGFGRAR